MWSAGDSISEKYNPTQKVIIVKNNNRGIYPSAFSIIAGLILEYDGAYPFAVAAYNAGPLNVRRWINNAGDPRQTDIDTIDWIERIPFRETRNYVQRVLENLAVYRLLQKNSTKFISPKNYPLPLGWHMGTQS